MRSGFIEKRLIFMGIGAMMVIWLLVVLSIAIGRSSQRDELYVQSKTAISQGDMVKLRKLLQRGAPADGVDYALIRGTPLMWAGERGDLPMMRLLIQKGANVNRQALFGATALMTASTPQAVQLLVDAGANPLLRDNQGHSAWDYMKGIDEKSATILKRAAENWRAQSPQGE